MLANGKNLLSVGYWHRLMLPLSSYNVLAAARVSQRAGTSSVADNRKGQKLSTCSLNSRSSRGTGEGGLSSLATCGISNWMKFPSLATITPSTAMLNHQVRRFSFSRSHKQTKPDDSIVNSYGLYGNVQEIQREIQWFNVDTDKLVELLASGDIQLFDVREPEELVETGQIPGAVNLPLGEVETALEMSPEAFQEKYGVPKPSKEDKNIMFHCRVGIRSLTAIKTAHALGYSKARHHVQGWLGWEQYLQSQK